MIYAQKLAKKAKVPLCVCFCLVPTFLDATIRQYDFMMKGLQEVEKVSVFVNNVSMCAACNIKGIDKSTDTILSIVWQC